MVLDFDVCPAPQQSAVHQGNFCCNAGQSRPNIWPHVKEWVLQLGLLWRASFSRGGSPSACSGGLDEHELGLG